MINFPTIHNCYCFPLSVVSTFLINTIICAGILEVITLLTGNNCNDSSITNSQSISLTQFTGFCLLGKVSMHHRLSSIALLSA